MVRRKGSIEVHDAMPMNLFRQIRAIMHHSPYLTERNPVDGVEYPLINRNLEPALEHWMVGKLSLLHDEPIYAHMIFGRLSTEGVQPPHWAHTDDSMAAWTALYSINGGGETWLLTHKRTGVHAPTTQQTKNIVHADTNNEDAWEANYKIKWEPNMLATYPSHWVHAAVPREGFGQSAADGRLMVVCFYYLSRDL